MTKLAVLAHLPARHQVSCAVFDPTPGRCDCGAQPIPLVSLAQAEAAIERASKATQQGERSDG